MIRYLFNVLKIFLGSLVFLALILLLKYVLSAAGPNPMVLTGRDLIEFGSGLLIVSMIAAVFSSHKPKE